MVEHVPRKRTSGLLAQYLEDYWIDIHQTFRTGGFWNSENVLNFRSEGQSVQLHVGPCLLFQTSSLSHTEHPKVFCVRC